MSGPLADQLVEVAAAALRRLGEVQSVSEPALTTLEGITEQWGRRPLRVGIAGDNPAIRGLVFDVASGGAFATRPQGAAPIHMRRGEVTKFRALKDAWVLDERTQQPANSTAVDVARAEVVSRQHELAGIDRGIPALVLAPPHRFAFWLWPLRWWRRWRAKSSLVAREQATAMLAAANERLADAEARQVDPVGARALFLADALIARNGITTLEVELAAGPLPEGVELVELAGANRAEADVDAALVATRDGVLAPVSGSPAVRIGPTEQVIRALPTFLVHARALNLARRALDRLDASRKTLESQLRTAEVDFELRLARLRALQVADPATLRTEQLEVLGPKILASVSGVMEHASTHMGAELAELAKRWTDLCAHATSNDDLSAAVAQIDAEWPDSARRIVDEVRVLVTGGVAGSAHDLYNEMVAPLRELGFSETGKRLAPEVTLPPILPSLTSPTNARWAGAIEKLTGLFKKFEAKRDDLANKVHARAEHLRAVASAELLDAQPLLNAALAETLAAELAAAVSRHSAHVAEQLAATEEAIRAEREALYPVRRARDDAEAAGRDLVERIGYLEAELPGTAAASAAARLSMGSITTTL
jgi:hypothetical protein